MAQPQSDNRNDVAEAARADAAATPPEVASQIETQNLHSVAESEHDSQVTGSQLANTEGYDALTQRTAHWPRIPGYDILAELGRGGMGIVYKARQTSLNRFVALKVMRNDLVAQRDQAARFEREMHALARLDHPHLVRIYEIGQHEGQPYYTMPFLAGGTLTEQRERLLGEQRTALILMEKIARAVQYAHEQGVLHRDLKPGNVLLDEQGEPRVSDFGLAKICDADVELTQTGAVLGTPPYMAPEVIAGRTRQVGAQTDIWALGVMLYELLLGRRPFVGETGEEVKRKILCEEAPSPRTLRPELDPALERILASCLEKDPAHRYQTAGALADDLARSLRGERPQAPPEPWRRRLGRGVRRHAFKATVLFLATCVLAAGSFLAYSPDRQPLQPADPGPPEQLVLIGDNGPPKSEFSWMFGEKDATTGINPDGTFFLRTDKVAAIQLLASPPWPTYRLQAEIRHDDSADSSEVGLTFASRQLLAPEKGLCHAFFMVRFADQGKKARGIVTLRFEWHSDQSAGGSTFTPKDYVPASKLGQSKPWRLMQIDVGPDEVEVFWEGDSIGRHSKTQLLGNTAGLKRQLGVSADYVPQGGVGLNVSYGAASLRRVKLIKR